MKAAALALRDADAVLISPHSSGSHAAPLMPIHAAISVQVF
jgi:hypothetical protein